MTQKARTHAAPAVNEPVTGEPAVNEQVTGEPAVNEQGREGMQEPAGGLAPNVIGLPVAPTLAGVLVETVGGRYSSQMGIDIDAGDPAVERWFVASTLFGTRIAAAVAERAFAALEASGIHRITDAEAHEWDELVALLDSAGYARYDGRTASRLQALARQVTERYGGEVAEIGRRFQEPDELAAALDELTGWGPVTVSLFLRELRGVWPGARPGVDRRAVQAGQHLGLLSKEDPFEHLGLVAALSHVDLRDLEAALVRLALAHPKTGDCPGGRGCVVLARSAKPGGIYQQLALPGCRTITVRTMRADDGPSLAALYASLDEDDVYRRFFSTRLPPDSFIMQMADVARRGGGGLVATASSRSTHEERPAPAETMVAEATYTPLANGNAELGITVTRGARGWLGPYLLDVLLEDAAAHWFPNLEADVLAANAPMLAMLRRRGYAVIDMADHPVSILMAVGTAGRVPSWPPARAALRVLVEAPSGSWEASDALRRAGVEVLGCPSPSGGWAGCPELRGTPCPLASGADVIVVAVPGEPGRLLIGAHRRLHASVPLFAELAPEDPDPGVQAERLTRGATEAEVDAILRRVDRRSLETNATRSAPPRTGER